MLKWDINERKIYPGCQEVQSALEDFFKSRQGEDIVLQYTWYNNGRISHILQPDIML